jgi:hypothetical protein
VFQFVATGGEIRTVLIAPLRVNMYTLSAAGVLLQFLHPIKTEYWYGRGVSGKVVLIVEPS